MPDPFWQSIFQSIASAGLPAVLMAIAVWYLQKSNAELITQLNKEREERLCTLEAHIETCDKERSQLREKVIEMALRLGKVEEKQH